MLGTWRWNVGFGIFGLLLTVLFSLGRNPWSVTLFRGMYAFIAFFILAYLVRTILAFVLKPPALVGEGAKQDESRGGQLDLLTPDESEDLNDLLKSQLKAGSAAASDKQGDGFQPLKPPQFVSAQNSEPEELAKAIRHLTGE